MVRVVDDECLNEGGARATTPAPAPAPAPEPGPGGPTGPEPEPAAHTPGHAGYLGTGYVQVRHSHIRHQPASPPTSLPGLPGQPSPDNRPGHDTTQHGTTKMSIRAPGSWARLGTRYVYQLGSGNPVQIYGPLRVREKYQVVVAAAVEVTWAARVEVQPMFMSILCLCVRVQYVRSRTT